MSLIKNPAIAQLSTQFKVARSFLEGTLQDVTPEQVMWRPAGKPGPIGAQYAHILVSEDRVVNALLAQGMPLAASGWEGKTGLSALPPQTPPWDTWAKQVQVDLPALKAYAQAVYAATDAYLDALSDDHLQTPLDLAAIGLGQQTVGSLLAITVANASFHCGEIACLKGLQGAKGYPF